VGTVSRTDLGDRRTGMVFHTTMPTTDERGGNAGPGLERASDRLAEHPGLTRAIVGKSDLSTDDPTANTTRHDLVTTCVIDAPVQRVWQAWTDPEQVMRWWGPQSAATHRKQHPRAWP
jgi:Activator of Hsp90 ATPase homolog 1-like protein